VKPKLPQESDFVVGGGAAGCVLAARLSEDPEQRVLLLEAGPELESPMVTTPGAALGLLGTDAVYGDVTVPQEGAAGWGSRSRLGAGEANLRERLARRESSLAGGSD